MIGETVSRLRVLLLATYQSEPVNAPQLLSYRSLPNRQGGRGNGDEEMSIPRYL